MQLSVDERMVKSEACTQFRQYIRNKQTKWGYKYCVWQILRDTQLNSTYIAVHPTKWSHLENGLACDIVSKLITPFVSQGYQQFCYNFYTSEALFSDLLKDGIVATGTLRTNRAGVLKEVRILKDLGKNKVRRRTRYYIRT